MQPMPAAFDGAEQSITLVTRGDVPPEEVEYAMHRMGTLIDKVKEPILFARVKLTLAPDPARPRPALAQALIDVNGDLIRAHVDAETMPAAIDLVQARLRAKLEHRAERRNYRHTRPDQSGPGEWRHGDRPTIRPDHFDRPPEEREIVRHKTFALEELRPDEAAFDMGRLDYDFYLFHEVDSGEDAVIERMDDGSYRLIRLHSVEVGVEPSAVPITLADARPATLTIEEAVDRLEALGERFLFFADADTERGHVLYHRYDGHYGLIAPA